MMETAFLKIGTLAKKTGLTVRTLHYYEEKGILLPAKRSEKGYRLYGRHEIQRLQKVLSLQHLGFPLSDIRLLLDRKDYSLQHVLELHMERIRIQMRIQEQLFARLKTISDRLRAQNEISTEALLQTIEVTTMYEKYYTRDQLETLKQRGEELGEEGMQKGQADWTELNNAFRHEMESGTDPADEKVQALAAKMQQLIDVFTGGDPAIERSLGKMYQEEGPEKASRGAIDRALFEYIGKARDIFNA